jgi:hypothetical protein
VGGVKGLLGFDPVDLVRHEVWGEAGEGVGEGEGGEVHGSVELRVQSWR